MHTLQRVYVQDESRRGAATVDYVLVLGIILPLAAIAVPLGIRMMRAVFEFFATWVAWPFM